MFKTLTEIVRDNWQWRGHIKSLATFEIVKKTRGAVLSWAWLIIKPSVYVFCFWFAIDVGLRAGNTGSGDYSYLLWLCAGIVPWNFISDMLGAGSDVYRRYPYLVNKIKFPLSAIPSIFTTASMLLQFMLLACLFIVYFASGEVLSVYLLQIPILLLLMWLFWTLFSLLVSLLSALSKDISQLIHALATPLFWLSGVIFNIEDIHIGWIQVLFNFNPVTFFVDGWRHAFCYESWFWNDLDMCIGFGVIFLIVALLATLTYKGLNQEVRDVL